METATNLKLNQIRLQKTLMEKNLKLYLIKSLPFPIMVPFFQGKYKAGEFNENRWINYYSFYEFLN